MYNAHLLWWTKKISKISSPTLAHVEIEYRFRKRSSLGWNACFLALPQQ